MYNISPPQQYAEITLILRNPRPAAKAGGLAEKTLPTPLVGQIEPTLRIFWRNRNLMV
jgi:hypothetical protein